MSQSSNAQAIEKNDTIDDDSAQAGQGGSNPENMRKENAHESDESSFQKPLNDITLIFHHGQNWFYQLFKLARAEMSLTIESYVLGIGLKIALAVIYFTLYIAICCLLATWVSQMAGSIYAGFATFIACQILVSIVIKMTVSRLESMRGFPQTKAQFAKLKEKTQVE